MKQLLYIVAFIALIFLARKVMSMVKNNDEEGDVIDEKDIKEEDEDVIKEDEK